MRRMFYLFPVVAALAGCADLFDGGKGRETSGPAAAAAPPAPTETPSGPGPARLSEKAASAARTVEDFDTTTAAERSKAVREARGGTEGSFLGTTIASLGDATQTGIWMKTPLVKEAGKGRVVNPATGDAVTVDLFPAEGAVSGGSQLSLAAFRLINAPITGLPELRVYRTGG